MQQMEYKTITVRGALFNVAESLNKKYAKHGWRLVYPQQGDKYTLCILERPAGYEAPIAAERANHVVTQQRLEQALKLLDSMVKETQGLSLVMRGCAEDFLLDMAALKQIKEGKK